MEKDKSKPATIAEVEELLSMHMLFTPHDDHERLIGLIVELQAKVAALELTTDTALAA